jgi:MSHA biogenesis protein MshG
MKLLLQELRASLDQGRELATALARRPQVFSPFYDAMV